MPKNECLFDTLTALGCAFAFVYSLTGGIVHQEYNDPRDHVKYTAIWTIGTMFGFVGFGLCGYAGYCIGLPVNTWSWCVFGLLEAVFLCVAWTYKEAIKVLTSVTFLALVFIVVGSLVQVQSQRGNRERYRHNMRAFAVLCSGLVVIFVGAVCELCKVSRSPAFNYNAIYHVCTTVGLGVAYYALIFAFDYKSSVLEALPGPKM